MEQEPVRVPVQSEPGKKPHKPARILGAAALGLLVLGGIWFFLRGKEDVCAIDFMATILDASTTPMTDIEAGRTLLSQFLTEYTKTTECETNGIKDFEITSVGNKRDVENDFLLDATFDVIPTSLEMTIWKTAETKVDGEWIRGKQATLGIQRLATSTYRLVLP